MSEVLIYALEVHARRHNLPQTIEEVKEHLDDPEQRQAILREEAESCQYHLATLFGKEDVSENAHELDKAKFYELYDAALPTFAVDALGSFAGYPIMAQQAQRRRERGKPTCNIVIVPTGTSCGSVAMYDENSARLELNHGVLIDEAGMAYYGEFPQSVSVDLVVTCNMRFAAQCEDRGIRTTSPTEIAGVGSKNNLPEQVAGLNVHAPQRVTLPELMSSDEPVTAEYVIKPASGKGGRGVRLFDTLTNREDALAYATLLDVQGYDPIIEARVRTWPLRISKEGDKEEIRLDWNTRAIIAHGKVIDMYVRASEWGKVVNVGRGARAIRLEEFDDLCDSPDEAQMLRTKLQCSAQELANRFQNHPILALDLTVSEQGEPYIIEINNGEIIGGLQTISKLYDGLPRKSAWANTLIEAWLRHYPRLEQPTMDPVSDAALERNFEQLLLTANFIGSGDLLINLSFDEVVTFMDRPEGLVRWAGMCVALGKAAASRQMYRKVIDIFPLEAAAEIKNVGFNDKTVSILMSLARRMQTFYPDEPYWQACLLTMYAFKGNISKVKALYQTPDNFDDFFKKLNETVAPEEEMIKGLYRVYFENGYEQAMHAIQAAKATPEGDELSESLAILALQLAASECDGEGVATALTALRPLDPEGGYTTFLEAMHEELLASPEGISIVVAVNLAAEKYFGALAAYIDQAEHLPVQMREQMAHQIAAALSAALNEPNYKDWFADFLCTRAYGSLTFQLDSSQEGAKIPSIVHLIWAMSRDDDEQTAKAFFALPREVKELRSYNLIKNAYYHDRKFWKMARNKV